MLSGLVLSPGFLSSRGDQQKSGTPLAKGELIEMVKSRMPVADLDQLVRDYGLAFELTPDVDKKLRQAGATDELVKALHDLTAKPEAPNADLPKPAPDPASKPRAPEHAVLLITATPGGALAYLDDEPVGKTSPAGRLKLSQLSPGDHMIRLSLEGYRDYEKPVQLQAGETSFMVALLEAAPPAPKPVVATPQPRPASPPPVRARELPHFYVAHRTGLRYGFMTIGDGYIRFRSEDGRDAFDFPLNEVREARRNPIFDSGLKAFHIRLQDGGNYNFAWRRNGRWANPEALLQLINRETGGN